MRFHRFLLYLYPASFRGEYGGELRDIFVEKRRQAGNPLSILCLWLREIADTIFNAGCAHWDILRQDLRHAARMATRAPGFALTAIAVTGLGIGATTAVFSVADHALLHPFTFSDANRLVQIWQRTPAYSHLELSPPNFYDWRRRAGSFETMAAYAQFRWNVVGEGDPQRIEGTAATPDFFKVLSVKPLTGRLFTDEDAREGAPRTVILSYSFWQTVMGGRMDVLTKSVRLDNDSFSIVGIMPPDFVFPFRGGQLWIPLSLGDPPRDARDDYYLDAIARLKPGVSMQQARTEMGLIADRLASEFPRENEKMSAVVEALSDQVAPQARLLLWAVFGASLCMLLIACTNLANLFLTKSISRRKELAVRAAIGAGRERLVRQLLTESVLLAAGGGAVGILVAMAALPFLSSLVPGRLPLADANVLDARVLVFTAVLTLGTGLIFGVLPAWRVSHGVDQDGLREGSRSGIGGHRDRMRSALVVAEITISLLLLVSAGLLLRALLRIQAIDPGFRPDRVLAIQTPIPMSRYSLVSTRMAFYPKVLSEVRALPGVSAAACISSLPMGPGGGGIWPVTGTGNAENERDSNGTKTVGMRLVSSSYFETMAIPLRSGRDISESDTLEAPPVAVVSQSFAERYWPGRDPIGRRFHFAFENFPFAQQDKTVVGVVGDVRFRGLERLNEPQVYLPYKQLPDRTSVFYSPQEFVVRSSLDTAALSPSIRRIIQKADPELPISAIRPMRDIVDTQTAPRSMQLHLVFSFAGLSLFLAGIGIYGLLSFAVGQRSAEFGLRIALGAQPRNILSMVLREGIILAGLGGVAGLVLSYFAGWSMQAVLAGVSPLDPATVAAAAIVALVMTLSGSLLPAVRAMRTDPASVIRMD